MWVFLSFLWLIYFLKKSLLYDSLVLIPNSSFLLQFLHTWYLYALSHFRWHFQKLHSSLTWKKCFFQNHFYFFLFCIHIILGSFLGPVFIFLSSVFLSLNLIILRTFFINNPWLNACFTFLMCTKYIVFSLRSQAKSF